MRFLVFCVVASGAMSSAGASLADTHAPSAQTFTLMCGGSMITVVSPSESAEAAQVVGTTGASVLELVTDSAGNVLFEHPSYPALKASKLTTCRLDDLTFLVLNTPQTMTPA